MRPWILLALFVVALVETFWVLPTRSTEVAGSRLFPLGAIHVHSHFSHDGGGTLEEIAQAARQAQLDFVVITDHDTVGAKRAGQERNYDGVDVFVAMESSTPAGHLLYFFPSQLVEGRSDQNLVDLSWSHLMNGPTHNDTFVAVAHPSNLKRPWDRLDKMPEGLEVVNFDSQWQRQLYESVTGFFTTVALLPLNPFLAALRFSVPYPKDFVAWDSMNAVSQGHFGILGHDTHAKLILRKDISVRWPDYRQPFRVGANQIFLKDPLPEDFEGRRDAIFRAVREGRMAVAFPVVFPVEGADWTWECPNLPAERSGASAPLSAGCAFSFTLPPGFPYGASLRIWKDGSLLQERDVAGSTRWEADGPGVYRLEVWAQLRSPLGLLLRPPSPYLFYNPIYLR